MSDINRITLTGRIKSGVEYSYTKGNTRQLLFDLTGNFGVIRCYAFGEVVDYFGERYNEGDVVAIDGFIAQNKFVNKKNQLIKGLQVVVEKVGVKDQTTISGHVHEAPTTFSSNAGTLWYKFTLVSGAHRGETGKALRGMPVYIECMTDDPVLGKLIKKNFGVGDYVTVIGRLSIAKFGKTPKVFVRHIDTNWVLKKQALLAAETSAKGAGSIF
jgi:single-stranded DNA-binding protein